MILDTRVLKWAADHPTPLEGADSPARGHALIDGDESLLLGERDDVLQQGPSSPSLGPSQSASQQGHRLANGSTGMNSKYFFKPQSQFDNATPASPVNLPVVSVRSPEHTAKPAETLPGYTSKSLDSRIQVNMDRNEVEEGVLRPGQSPGSMFGSQFEDDRQFMPASSMPIDHDWGYHINYIEEPLPSSYDDITDNDVGLDYVDYEGSLLQAQDFFPQDALSRTVGGTISAEELCYDRFDPTSYENVYLDHDNLQYEDPELVDMGMLCGYDDAEMGEYASDYGDGLEYGALDHYEPEYETGAQYEWESNGYSDDHEFRVGGSIDGDYDVSKIELDEPEVQGYDFYDDEYTQRFHPRSQGVEKEESMWEESIGSDDGSVVPMQRFSQGRALLLGLSEEDEGRYIGLRKGLKCNEVSQAEADVVEHMSGHWLPQKL